tara:strand:+ start:344 stop:745 length:402 start_codon:yes stop_codon:yes gene_type:complete
MNKFFYFRTVDVKGDDDTKDDSLLVSVDKITGIQAINNTTITIYFESKLNDLGESAFGDQHFINSSIVLNIEAGSRKVVMEAIAIASNAEPHNDGVVVIADDVTNTYVSKHIDSVGTITTASQVGSDVDTNPI